jgi:hypothetical protein
MGPTQIRFGAEGSTALFSPIVQHKRSCDDAAQKYYAFGDKLNGEKPQTSQEVIETLKCRGLLFFERLQLLI